MAGTLSNFNPALTRGISNHYLYESEQYPSFLEHMFHVEDMDGRYEDDQTWEGMGVPQLHMPMQTVNMGGVKPSFGMRYVATSWTLGIVIPIEDKRDDLYGIIHKFFPMAGGEFARSYYYLKQLLAANLFGLYGFQSGTSVPYSPDGVSFFNTAHPMSLANTATTWANRPSVDADLSIATAQMADAALRVQVRPNGLQKIPNSIEAVIVHPNERLIAKQIFNFNMERGTADWNRNFLSDQEITVVANPYWEYSGTAGAATTPASFNSYYFRGKVHYCKWKNRSDLELFPRFDNTILADIITALMRLAFGVTDPRGLWGSKGA